MEWICSGVPTTQPAPESQTADLLRERELLLFPVEPAQRPSRTRSRQLIGYVTREPEVMRRALLIADAGDVRGEHPMILAARWVQAGCPADSATC